MRSSTVEMMKKVKNLLIESLIYLSAQDIAERCNLSVASIYRIIRLLREEGTGIHATPQGYILSEFAEKKDDTHFMRRLNGRRTSDLIAIQSAAPHIKKRWRGLEDKQNIGIIIAPLNIDRGLLDAGLQSIKALEDKYGL